MKRSGSPGGERGGERAFVELSTVFAALANRDRLAIMEVLRDSPRGPMSISELAAEVEVSRFAMSRHLDILRNAGLVRAERSRQRVLHSIAESSVEVVEDWVISFSPALHAVGEPHDARTASSTY